MLIEVCVTDAAMKKPNNICNLVTLCFFVGFASLGTAIYGQTLPVNFEYMRETGQDTGVPIFTLRPRDEAVTFDASRGSPFEALGLLAQPEREKFSAMFYNAKKKYEFSTSRDKTCTLTVDGEISEISSYFPLAKSKIGKLYVEVIGFEMKRDTFAKMLGGRDILIRCGPVKYSLDQDNIDAFRFYASEVNRDLVRRNKTFLK